jgi:nucleotide-binding universal stress UspA family protein
MFSKVLVAIDRSAGSKQVFERALSLAKAGSKSLILLHVLSIEEPGSPAMFPYLIQQKKHCIHVDPKIMRQANEIYDRQWSDFKQQGIQLLRSFTKKAIAAGVSTEFSQITGHPSSTICEFAQACQADVIVIGRRGHSGLKEMFLGSVSNYVVHHAPCSVLLVNTWVETNHSSVEEIESQIHV